MRRGAEPDHRAAAVQVVTIGCICAAGRFMERVRSHQGRRSGALRAGDVRQAGLISPSGGPRRTARCNGSRGGLGQECAQGGEGLLDLINGPGDEDESVAFAGAAVPGTQGAGRHGAAQSRQPRAVKSWS